MVRKNINEVNPRVTPKIRGIVFVIPKLNPEYDATTLFGPCVKAATNQKRAIDNISKNVPLYSFTPTRHTVPLKLIHSQESIQMLYHRQ